MQSLPFLKTLVNSNDLILVSSIRSNRAVRTNFAFNELLLASTFYIDILVSCILHSFQVSVFRGASLTPLLRLGCLLAFVSAFRD